MKESNIEQDSTHFIFPSFKDEIGEIERVQKHFGIKAENFVEKFLERARRTELVRLSDEVWGSLENTDSRSDNILRGDWQAVEEHSNAPEVKRDWQSLKAKIQTGMPVDAPVIARRGESLHLVADNTRLMVTRALGIYPEVLIVDITDFQ